jgi:DNA invertase Pin-like site-specific DNA recombinase
MMGIFAEFERALIVERTVAGLARARANGSKLGRPRINSELQARIEASLVDGVGIQRTARLVRVGVGTVQRIKRAMALAL